MRLVQVDDFGSVNTGKPQIVKIPEPSAAVFCDASAPSAIPKRWKSATPVPPRPSSTQARRQSFGSSSTVSSNIGPMRQPNPHSSIKQNIPAGSFLRPPSPGTLMPKAKMGNPAYNPRDRWDPNPAGHGQLQEGDPNVPVRTQSAPGRLETSPVEKTRKRSFSSAFSSAFSSVFGKKQKALNPQQQWALSGSRPKPYVHRYADGSALPTSYSGGKEGHFTAGQYVKNNAGDQSDR